jgi:hypothetical protein
MPPNPWINAVEAIARMLGYRVNDIADTYEIMARIEALRGNSEAAETLRIKGEALGSGPGYTGSKFVEQIEADFPRDVPLDSWENK